MTMKWTIAIFAALAVSTYAVPVEVEYRGLRDDLKDFLALVPVDKIEELFYEYLGEDEQFQSAMDYIMSDEFTSLLQEVENMPEVKKFMSSLVQHGLPVYEYVNKLNEFLNIPKISPNFRSFRKPSPPGVKGFLQRVREIVPQKALEDLYKQKLETSPEFRDLINHLKSAESQQFIDKMMQHPKMKKFMEVAEKNGVDVQEVLDNLTSILGLKFPSRPQGFLKMNAELEEELLAFLNLSRRKNIGSLFEKYMRHDHSFRHSIYYLRSEEFRTSLVNTESLEQFVNAINFLEESGVPARKILKEINGAFKIPDVGFKHHHDLGGMPGFLAAVKELLPLEDINKLYAERLQNSVVFKAFVQQMFSEKAYEIFSQLVAQENVQHLLEDSRKHEIDFVVVYDIVVHMFGFNNGPPSSFATEFRKEKTLGEELQDFVNLVPVWKIKDLAMYYLSNDNQFQELVDYVLSEEFVALIVEVESMPEVKKFINYLHVNGVAVYEHLNEVHKFLGIEPIKPTRSFKNIGGVKGFLKELKEMIPEKQLRELFEQKLKTSKVFAEFVEKLKSQDAQNLVNKIMHNKVVEKFIQKLNLWDVNFQEVFDVITQMLGINFPIAN